MILFAFYICILSVLSQGMIDTTIRGLYIHDPENNTAHNYRFFFLAPTNDFYRLWRQWAGQWLEVEQELRTGDRI